MKLLGSTKSYFKDENSENVPKDVVINCNIVNDYQQDLRVLYTFVRNKSFGQLLDISSKKLYF